MTKPDSSTRLNLHRQMWRIRATELAAARHYTEWEMRCPVHLCVGQEAACVGPTAALEQRDSVMSGHRAHGHYLGKGGNLLAMMDEMYGKATGCASGLGGSMHLIDLEAGFIGSTPIVGSTIAIAVGLALSSSIQKDQQVTMVYFGDGAVEAGIFHESLNFAVLKRLPIVFVCENNQFSVYSPMEVRQPPHRPIYTLAAAHGMPSHQLDGNDVELCWAMATEAVRRARSGEGPSFLELSTWRWLEHCGPHVDDQLGYRTPAEAAEWKEKDPIRRHATLLMAEGVADLDTLTHIQREAELEAEAAIAHAKAAPWPTSDLVDRLAASSAPYSTSLETESCV